MNVSVFLCMFMVLSMFLLSGCQGTHHGRSVDPKTAVLVSPDVLQEGSTGQALYRYVNPKFDIHKYSAIIVEPVIIAKDGEISSSQRENYQKLANNAYVYIVREMEKEIKVVKTSGKDTLNLQVAQTVQSL